MAVTHTDPPTFDKIAASALYANASVATLSETTKLIQFSGQPGRHPDDGSIPDDVEGQIDNVLRRFTGLLEHVGAKKSDINHITYFITASLTPEQLAQFGPKFSVWLEGNRPASSLLKVTELMNPKYLLEIEMSAIVQQ